MPDATLEDLLKPYSGQAKAGVDCSTLAGKIMSGYQGWFRAPGDGWSKRWGHYEMNGEFRPGSCKIDAWPDVGELDLDERFDTPFRLADGGTAQVFSSANPKSALRHFKWMEDYGLDGVFVQRFFSSARDCLQGKDLSPAHVLNLCRQGANQHGRIYALMYDLSGMREGEQGLLMEDWRKLKDLMRLTEDPAYLRHRGKPVVAVWGIGFPDRPDYGLESCAQIVDFLKNDPKYGGNTVMLGVPTGWREQSLERPYIPLSPRTFPYIDGDCMQDKRLHEIIKSADIVSPWAVDRVRTPEGARMLASNVWAADQRWCDQYGLDFLPVAFPGFSWKNMFPSEPFNAAPRLKGELLWALYHGALQAGASMIYQAMFDEVDEGTAIFKCSNNPPVGASRFLDMEGMPADHYLWLAGQGTRMLRSEIPLDAKLPLRSEHRPMTTG